MRLSLGFDAFAKTDAIEWRMPNVAERDLYFIRPEIDAPVSVDRLICPSVFQPGVQTMAETKLFLTRFSRSLHVEETTLDTQADWPESEVGILGLWINSQRMLGWLEDRPAVKKFVRFPVATGVFLDDITASGALWKTVAESNVSPSNPLPQWTLLGYDVADEGQTSALSNCQFQYDEIAKARMRWQSHLNEWGLLDDFADAGAFVEFSNKRVSEHAPFYVYEIHKISP